MYEIGLDCVIGESFLTFPFPVQGERQATPRMVKWPPAAGKDYWNNEHKLCQRLIEREGERHRAKKPFGSLGFEAYRGADSVKADELKMSQNATEGVGILARKPVRTGDWANLSQNATLSHFATAKKGSSVQEFSAL